jgi:hypothetical protein
VFRALFERKSLISQLYDGLVKKSPRRLFTHEFPARAFVPE